MSNKPPAWRPTKQTSSSPPTSQTTALFEKIRSQPRYSDHQKPTQHITQFSTDRFKNNRTRANVSEYFDKKIFNNTLEPLRSNSTKKRHYFDEKPEPEDQKVWDLKYAVEGQKKDIAILTDQNTKLQRKLNILQGSEDHTEELTNVKKLLAGYQRKAEERKTIMKQLYAILKSKDQELESIRSKYEKQIKQTETRMLQLQQDCESQVARAEERIGNLEGRLSNISFFKDSKLKDLEHKEERMREILQRLIKKQESKEKIDEVKGILNFIANEKLKLRSPQKNPRQAQQMDNLQNEYQKLAQNYESLIISLDKLNTQLHHHMAQDLTCQDPVQRLQHGLKTLLSKFEEKRQQSEDLETEFARLEQDMARKIKEQVKRKDAEIQRLSTQNSELVNQLSALDSQNQSLLHQQKLDDESNQELQCLNDQLNIQVVKQQSQISMMNAQIEDQQKILNSNEKILQSQYKIQEELHEEIKELKYQLQQRENDQRLRQQIMQLNNQKESLVEQMEQLQAELQEKKTKLQELEAQVKQLSIKNNKLQTELKSQLEEARLTKSIQQHSAAVKEENSTLKRQLEEAVKQLKELKTHQPQIIEQMTQLLHTKFASPRVKTRQKSEPKFLDLNFVGDGCQKEFSGLQKEMDHLELIMRQLDQKVNNIEFEKREMQLKLESSEDRMEKLNGMLQAQEEKVSRHIQKINQLVSAKEELEEKVASQDEEIQQLEQEKAQLCEINDELRQIQDQLKSECEQLRGVLEEKEFQLNTLAQENLSQSQFEQDFKQVQDQYNQLMKVISTQDEKIEEQAAHIQAQAEEIEKLKERLLHYQKEQASLNSSIKFQRHQLESELAEKEELKASVSSLNQANLQQKEVLKKVTSQLELQQEDFNKRLSDKQAQLEALQQQLQAQLQNQGDAKQEAMLLAELERKIESLFKQNTQLSQKNQELENQIGVAQKSAFDLQDQNEQLLSEISCLTSQAKVQYDQINNLQNQNLEVEEKLADLQQDHDISTRESAQLRDHLKRTLDELKTKQEKLHENETQNAVLLEENLIYKQQLLLLTKKVNEARQTVSRLSAQIQEVKHSHEAIRSQHIAPQRWLDETKLFVESFSVQHKYSLEQRFHRHRQQVKETELRLSLREHQTSSQLAELQDQVLQLNSLVQRYELQLQNDENLINEKNYQIDAQNEQIALLSNQISSQQAAQTQFDGLQNAINDLTEQRQSLTVQAEEQAREISDQQAQIVFLQKQVKKLQSEIANLQKENSVLIQDQVTIQEHLERLEADNQLAKEQLSANVEEAQQIVELRLQQKDTLIKELEAQLKNDQDCVRKQRHAEKQGFKQLQENLMLWRQENEGLKSEQLQNIHALYTHFQRIISENTHQLSNELHDRFNSQQKTINLLQSESEQAKKDAQTQIAEYESNLKDLREQCTKLMDKNRNLESTLEAAQQEQILAQKLQSQTKQQSRPKFDEILEQLTAFKIQQKQLESLVAAQFKQTHQSLTQQSSEIENKLASMQDQIENHESQAEFQLSQMKALWSQQDEMRDSLKEMREDNEILMRDKLEAEQKIQALQMEIRDLQQKLTESRRGQEELFNSNYELRDQLSRASAENQLLKGQADEAASRVKSLQDLIRDNQIDINSQLVARENAVLQAQDEIRNLTQQLKQKIEELSRMEAELKEQIESNENLKLKLEQEERSKAEAKQVIAQLTEQMEDLRIANKHLMEQLDEIKRQCENQSSQQDAQFQDLQSKLEEVKSEKDSLNIVVDQLKTEADAQGKLSMEDKDQIMMLNLKVRSLEDDAKQIQIRYQANLDELRALESSKKQLESDFTDLQQLHSKLERQIELDKHERQQGTEELKNRIQILEDQVTDLSQQLEQARLHEASLLSENAAVKEGALRAEALQRKDFSEQLQSLQDQELQKIEDLEARLKEAQSESQGLSTQIQQYEMEFVQREDWKEKLENLQSSYQELEETNQILERDVENYKRIIQELKADLSKQKDLVIEKAECAKALFFEIEETKSSLQHHKHELSNQIQESNKLKEQLERLLQESQSQPDPSWEQVTLLEEENKRLSNLNLQLTQEIQKLKSEIQALSDEYKDLQSQLQDYSQEQQREEQEREKQQQDSLKHKDFDQQIQSLQDQLAGHPQIEQSSQTLLMVDYDEKCEVNKQDCVDQAMNTDLTAVEVDDLIKTHLRYLEIKVESQKELFEQIAENNQLREEINKLCKQYQIMTSERELAQKRCDDKEVVICDLQNTLLEHVNEIKELKERLRPDFVNNAFISRNSNGLQSQTNIQSEDQERPLSAGNPLDSSQEFDGPRPATSQMFDFPQSGSSNKMFSSNNILPAMSQNGSVLQLQRPSLNKSQKLVLLQEQIISLQDENEKLRTQYTQEFRDSPMKEKNMILRLQEEVQKLRQEKEDLILKNIQSQTLSDLLGESPLQMPRDDRQIMAELKEKMIGLEIEMQVIYFEKEEVLKENCSLKQEIQSLKLQLDTLNKTVKLQKESLVVYMNQQQGIFEQYIPPLHKCKGGNMLSVMEKSLACEQDWQTYLGYTGLEDDQMEKFRSLCQQLHSINQLKLECESLKKQLDRELQSKHQLSLECKALLREKQVVSQQMIELNSDQGSQRVKMSEPNSAVKFDKSFDMDQDSGNIRQLLQRQKKELELLKQENSQLRQMIKNNEHDEDRFESIQIRLREENKKLQQDLKTRDAQVKELNEQILNSQDGALAQHVQGVLSKFFDAYLKDNKQELKVYHSTLMSLIKYNQKDELLQKFLLGADIKKKGGLFSKLL